MRKDLHTVTLDPEKCRGCISCMKRCPTEAIRVRNGKAKVLYDRCIGCGECVHICPHQAKLPAYDPFDIIKGYKYKIALPAPSLYGQFNNMNDINIILNGLIELGFDEVFEVAKGAELVSEATRIALSTDKIKKPIISSACPAIVQLVTVRFHNLMEHLVPFIAPVNVAARMARENAIKKGISKEDIGVFFISPCPAKVHALKTGLGLEEPDVDGVLAISEIYFKLLNVMPKLTEIKPLRTTGALGMSWASSGGEAVGSNKEKYLAADGIENCIEVLKKIEDGDLYYTDFVELNACVSGCVGGVLNIENPFVARARLRGLRRASVAQCNDLITENISNVDEFFGWERVPEVKDVDKLSENRLLALEKMEAIETLFAKLPHIDCGSCGAPSCRAFAVDVVNGEASIDSCPRMIKEENDG